MPEAVEKLGKLRIEVGLHARKTGTQKSTEGRTGFIGKRVMHRVGAVPKPMLPMPMQVGKKENREEGRRSQGA